LITVALQMILIIASMLALNYEQKDGGIEELKQLSGGSAALVVFGKMMAHLVIAWINFLLVVGIIFPLFEIGVPPATGKFFLLFTLFVLSSLSVGFFISALFKDLMLAGDVALFYTSPAFVFSGFTFPRWAMPWYDQYYAMIMPYTPFLDSFFKVYYMDLPLRYATDEMVRLSIFIVALIPPTIVLFRQSLKQPSTHATTV
jgi:ABC-2 type transport system permease protein